MGKSRLGVPMRGYIVPKIERSSLSSALTAPETRHHDSFVKWESLNYWGKILSILETLSLHTFS